jgi:WhiB family transcriptional regulator, redox-sensing transcriptional regulator
MAPRRASRLGEFWAAPAGHEPDRGALARVWDEGACATVDPEVFFPLPSGDPGPALKVCAGCPVRELCLDTFGPLLGHGVVGGLTEDQRQDLAAGDPEAAA